MKNTLNSNYHILILSYEKQLEDELIFRYECL